MPAVRERTPMIVALAGPSGSGKTFSALELATGGQRQDRLYRHRGPARPALCSAARRRHLARRRVPFRLCRAGGTLHSGAVLAKWRAAEQAGYAVIVTDSYSDEYVGEGGLVDMAAEEEKRVRNYVTANVIAIRVELGRPG